MSRRNPVDRRAGERIRALRLKLDLSQRSLAGRTREAVNYAHISRVETGDRMPSMETLVVLAEALGVTALELATGDHAGICPFCRRT